MDSLLAWFLGWAVLVAIVGSLLLSQLQPVAALALTVLIVASIGLYFVPTYVAKGKPHFTQVFILNLFLGWTFLGWVIALVWAAKQVPPSHPTT